jgi:hypothetical protein
MGRDDQYSQAEGERKCWVQNHRNFMVSSDEK